MKKGLMILIVICICFFKSGVKALYEEYKIGDFVKYNDIGFIVIENSDSNDEYVTLLKGEPLTYDEVNKYNTRNDIKVSNYLGYGGIPYYISDDADLKNDYEHSSVKVVVDAWALDNIKSNDLGYDINQLSARLLTIDELINNLGYSYENQGSNIIQYNNKVYSWLLFSYDYYTMSPYDLAGYSDVKNRTWGIEYGNLVGSVVDVNSDFIRPVVILRKNSIVKDSLINSNMVSKPNDKYKIYKQGEKIRYNGKDFYVLKNSDGNTSYVTLLKAEPLTMDEVKKYGQGHINNYINKSIVAPGEVLNINGYGGVQFDSSNTCGYVNGQNILSGCINDYNSSDIKYIVDAWAKDELNKTDLTNDSDNYKVRLIKIEELLDLGYNYWSYEDGSGMGVRTYKTPDWINNVNYWTMSEKEDEVWMLYSGNFGRLSGNYVTSANTVRPVINLSKEAIGGVLNENIDDSDHGVNDSDNIIGNDTNTNNDTKDNVINQIISVPDTLKSVNVKAIIFGIILITSGILGFIFVKKKRNNK